MKNKVKKVFNVLSYVFMGLILALVIYVTILGYSGKEVSVFGYKMYVVKTASMDPTIPVDTVILSKEEDYSRLDIGEVITFDFDSTLGVPNTHRIVGYYYEDVDGSYKDTLKHEIEYETIEEFYAANPGCEVVGYRTKGDNPTIENPDFNEVRFESIKGVYVRNLVVISFLYSILSNFFGFLFIILVPLFILLISQLISLYKVRQQYKLEKELEQKEKERLELEEKIKEEAVKEYLSKNEE